MLVFLANNNLLMQSNIDIIVKMLLAFIAGGIIGFERERHKKPVGFRTYVLVCLGSAVITMVGVETVRHTIELLKPDPGTGLTSSGVTPEILSNSLKIDTVRLSAQVVTGIGFLGAGTILHEKNFITGLTSAASLWTASMIGIAIGYGYYFIGIVATLLVTFTLLLSSLRSYYNKPQIHRNGDND